MRTLFVVPRDQEFGGVAAVVGNLSKYLKEKGHEVFFFHPDPRAILVRMQETKWNFPGYRLKLVLPFTKNYPIMSTMAFILVFPYAMYQLTKLIKRNRIQIVNIHYPINTFFYFVLCCKILGIPLVTSVHGADIMPKGRPRKTYSRVNKYLLSSSDRIVSPSHAFKKDVLRIFPEFRDKTITICNGVNLAELNDLKVKEDGHKVNRGRYILCIAAHREKKAIDVLIKSFGNLREIDPSLKLVLVGDGPLRGQLETLAKSLGIDGSVEFAGEKRRKEVIDLLHQCEIFVLPSRSEPFGIVVAEALACKKPVVSTATGGIREIIEHEQNGILVQPDTPSALTEALKRLLTNKELCQSIAHRGYQTVLQRFLCEHTGADYEALFKDLVAGCLNTRE